MIPHAQDGLCIRPLGTWAITVGGGALLVAAGFWLSEALEAQWPVYAGVTLAAAILLAQQCFIPLVGRRMLESSLRDNKPMRAIEASFCSPADKGRSRFFVAEREGTGEPVGCALVRLGSEAELKAFKDEPAPGPGNRGLASSAVASVTKVSVCETARRGGVGLMLMDAAEEAAREWGCASVELVTANQKAIAFYQRLGYGVDKGKQMLPWAPFRAAFMSKRLG